MTSKEQYNALLLAEKGRYDIIDHEPKKCGSCGMVWCTVRMEG